MNSAVKHAISGQTCIFKSPPVTSSEISKAHIIIISHVSENDSLT